MTIKTKMNSLLALIGIVTAVAGIVIFYFMNVAQHDVKILDALGRQRMLTQEMGKSVISFVMEKNLISDTQDNIGELNRYVTEVRKNYVKYVVKPAKKSGLAISMQPDDEAHPAVPFPATFARLVNKGFTKSSNISIDIISDAPINPDKNLKDDIDRRANKFLVDNVNKIYFEPSESDSGMLLKFYTADTAVATGCATCHTKMEGISYKKGDLLGIRRFEVKFSADVASGRKALNPSLDEYKSSVMIFGKTLKAFKSGGKYPINLAMTKFNTAQAIEDNAVQAKIREVEAMFIKLQASAEKLTSGSLEKSKRNKVSEAIVSQTNHLRDLSNDLVGIYDGIARKNQTAIRIALIAAGIIIFITLIVIGLYISSGIVKPINGVSDTMSKLADNNLNVTVPGLDRSDELGLMAQAVQVFKDSAIDKERLEGEQRQVQLENERKNREVHQFVDNVARLANAACSGDLTARLEFDGEDKSLEAVSGHLNQLVETVQAGIDETVSVLSAMAAGDLTKKMTGDYQGSFNNLKTDTSATIDRLKQVVGDITISTNTVLSSSSEISEGSNDLASRTEQQASSLEQTAAAMEELVATVRQNADNSKQANQFSSSARDSAQKGGEIVSKAVSAMSEIEESSEKISDIVKMIDEIAFQTNLLALNAAVEAARAGEAGKGFAVVASEVRALAQRSSEASKEIKTLIDSSVSQIKDGVQLVNQTGETLEEIVTSVKRVADIVSEISSASQEQATGLDEVNTAVTSMDEMTQQNAALVEETTAAAQSLEGQANALSKLVSFFNTGAEQPAKSAPAVSSAHKQQPADADADKVASEDTSSSGTDQDWQEF